VPGEQEVGHTASLTGGLKRDPQQPFKGEPALVLIFRR
jgi:hypothetical protein